MSLFFYLDRLFGTDGAAAAATPPLLVVFFADFLWLVLAFLPLYTQALFFRHSLALLRKVRFTILFRQIEALFMRYRFHDLEKTTKNNIIILPSISESFPYLFLRLVASLAFFLLNNLWQFLHDLFANFPRKWRTRLNGFLEIEEIYLYLNNSIATLNVITLVQSLSTMV